jgi:hypothetical protein
MTEPMEFFDHRHRSGKLTTIILILFSTISSFIFIPILISFMNEEDFDPIFLFVFITMFLSFSLLPFLIVYLTKRKSKRTVIIPQLKNIQFFEGKTLSSQLNFDQIDQLKLSRYTYTVKTKNGSNTITVFTTIAPNHEKLILSESTNFQKNRMFAESIAKTLRLPLINEEGEKREASELDIPFHKRPHPDFDGFSIPNFPTESTLQWIENGKEFVIHSDYSPIWIRFVASILTFVLFLLINLAIGDVFELSIFYWESLSPNIDKLIFLMLSLALASIPLALALYQKWKRKEIRITSEAVIRDSKSINFDHLEEVILAENRLSLIGDKEVLNISLLFFCDHSNVMAVKNAVIYGILTKANRGDASSFSKFQTEF